MAKPRFKKKRLKSHAGKQLTGTANSLSLLGSFQTGKEHNYYVQYYRYEYCKTKIGISTPEKFSYFEDLVYFANVDPFLLIHLYDITFFTFIHQKDDKPHHLEKHGENAHFCYSLVDC